MVFTVSDMKILTPSGLSGQTGSEWASHSRAGRKARSQWTAPKLKKYQFELLLRAQDGVDPRSVLKKLIKKAETNAADEFVIGSSPLSRHPFRITELSDEWSAVMRGGKMTECKVSMTVEEYV